MGRKADFERLIHEARDAAARMQFGQAADLYRKALEVEPGNRMIRIELANMERRTRRA